MNTFCEVLDQLYKKVLLGGTLENDSHDYILYLSPALSDQESLETHSLECPNTDGVQGKHWPPAAREMAILEAEECGKKNSQMSGIREMNLLQLTVIQAMVTKILSVEAEVHTKEKYREIIKILLHTAEIDSKLICMFQNSDKLLSHMATKCLAWLLYFQLKEKIALSNSWIDFCQKSLSEYSESNEVTHCLWTLTVVLKEIFKGTCAEKREILKQFLTHFDSTLETFYNSLFSQHFENFQSPSNIINSLISFIDLLEILIASRIYLHLHFRSQRILFWKPSYVLDVLTWPIQAFVKRKFIILIKKCLLRKVGEDLCRGSVTAVVSPDRHLHADMLALAHTVLQAMNLKLLKTLSAHRKPSHFGGTEVQPGCGHISGPDFVILRAASLVIMKSLEIKFQNCTSANEMKVDLQRYMSELLTFLKPHLQPALQRCNPCEWLSRVFIEQDDDMLEAARASLSIYLKLARHSETTESLTQEKEIWIHHTHENGYNPHCIFIFFLKNIEFDSTVLLDFLISSETCFLEYFVTYLKLLQKDWDNFFTICKNFNAPESRWNRNICSCAHSFVQDQSTDEKQPGCLTVPDSHLSTYAWISQGSDDSSGPLKQLVMSQETHAMRGHGLSSPRTSLSLVDYDSSDDSEAESTGQCLANSQQPSLHRETTKKIQDPAGTNGDNKELSLGAWSSFVGPKESNTPFSSDCGVAPNYTVSEVGILYRMVRCFEELQGAIYRLQKKNLFPYNPTALLKLLKRIEAIYNKNLNPL
ncbi:protein Lines homolog 1 [Ctenodactylus gundi]